MKVYNLAKESPAPQTSPPPPAPGAMMPGMMPGALPPNHPDLSGMPGSGAAGAAPASGIAIGTPPSNWKAKEPTTMRLASFDVAGANGAVADVSLIQLSGAAGGVLENVNRWQSQLGQPGLTAEELAQKSQHLDSPLGAMTVVDLQGLAQGADATKDGRIVAAIVENESGTFFFKLRGNTELVGTQKDEFLKWAGTVHK